MKKHVLAFSLALCLLALSACTAQDKNKTTSQPSSTEQTQTSSTLSDAERFEAKYTEYTALCKKVIVEHQKDFTSEIPLPYADKAFQTCGMPSFQVFCEKGEAAATQKLEEELTLRKQFAFDTYIDWRFAYSNEAYAKDSTALRTTSKAPILAGDTVAECLQKIKTEFSQYYKGHETELAEDMKVACDIFYGTAYSAALDDDSKKPLDPKQELPGVGIYQYNFEKARTDMLSQTKGRGYLPKSFPCYDAITAGPIVRQ